MRRRPRVGRSLRRRTAASRARTVSPLAREEGPTPRPSTRGPARFAPPPGSADARSLHDLDDRRDPGLGPRGPHHVPDGPRGPALPADDLAHVLAGHGHLEHPGPFAFG